MLRLAFLLFVALLPLTLPTGAPAEDPICTGYERLYQGDYGGAYEHFRQVAGREPENLAAGFGALMTLTERELPEAELDREFNQQFDRLVGLAQKRFDKNPRDAEALFYLAQAYTLRGRYRFEHSKGIWGAARDAAKSKKYSEELVKLQPNRADTFFALGIYNYYVDIAPAFIKFLRIFLFLPAGNRSLGLQQLERVAREGELFGPQAQLVLAEIYGWLQGRPQDALRLLDALHRRYPDSPQVSFAIANLYASPWAEAYEMAEKEFAEIVERAQAGHPHYRGSVGYRATLGVARARQQQWRLEEAVAALTSAIDSGVTQPDWVLPTFLLRRANYRALLNQPGARADLERLLAEKKWKDWHKAAQRLLRWMEDRARSGEAGVYAELIPGNRLVAEGKWAAAEEFYRRAEQKYPGDPQVRYRLAYLEFARGDYDQAAAGFEQIVASNPGRMPAWVKANSLLYRARVHDLRGQREQALKLYKTIVDDFEGEPAAGAARLGLLAPYRHLASVR